MLKEVEWFVSGHTVGMAKPRFEPRTVWLLLAPPDPSMPDP